MPALSLHWRQKRFYYAMLAPLVIIMLALYAYPVVYGVYLAFTKDDYAAIDAKPIWVGFANFITFFKSSDARRVVQNTLTFTLVTVAIEVILGLALAVALNRNFRAKGMARALILVPLMLAPVVVGYEWRWLYNDPYGLVNYFLMRLGILSAPIAWTTSARTAMASLVVAEVWYSTTFVAILCLGGLQSLPDEPLEAAIVDGASPLQRFFYVTLPLLRPVLLAAILIRVLDSFQVFDLVFILTYGGPGNLTEVMNTFTYKIAFRYFDLGYASAVAVISLFLMALISLVLARIINRNA